MTKCFISESLKKQTIKAKKKQKQRSKVYDTVFIPKGHLKKPGSSKKYQNLPDYVLNKNFQVEYLAKKFQLSSRDIFREYKLVQEVRNCQGYFWTRQVKRNDSKVYRMNRSIQENQGISMMDDFSFNVDHFTNAEHRSLCKLKLLKNRSMQNVDWQMSQSKQPKKEFSLAKKNDRKIFEKENSYSKILSIHEVWSQEMLKLVDKKPPLEHDKAHFSLLGAYIKVMRSKDANIIGLEGIVLEETPNLLFFGRSDSDPLKITTLIKNSLHEIEIWINHDGFPTHSFSMHGPSLQYRHLSLCS